MTTKTNCWNFITHWAGTNKLPLEHFAGWTQQSNGGRGTIAHGLLHKYHHAECPPDYCCPARSALDRRTTQRRGRGDVNNTHVVLLSASVLYKTPDTHERVGSCMSVSSSKSLYSARATFFSVTVTRPIVSGRRVHREGPRNNTGDAVAKRSVSPVVYEYTLTYAHTYAVVYMLSAHACRRIINMILIPWPYNTREISYYDVE